MILNVCNPKEEAINDLISFATSLEENSKNFSAQDWDNAIAQYDEICKNLDNYDAEYTTNEQENIGRAKGKCQTIFIRHAIDSGIGGFMRTLYQYKGLFEGMAENLDELLDFN